MSKKFVRSDSNRHSKIGKNRKKLQKWRKPRGRDNKIREKRKSYPRFVSIGYSTPRSEAGKVKGKMPVLVHNTQEIEGAKKGSILIIARVGARKKMEMIKLAGEKGFEIANMAKEKKNAA